MSNYNIDISILYSNLYLSYFFSFFHFHSAAEWLRPPRRKTHSNKIISYFVNNIKTKYSPFRLLSNNIATVFLLVVYFLINVGCGVWGAMDVFTTTPERGWLMLARFNGRSLVQFYHSNG